MKKKYFSAALVLVIFILWLLPEPVTRPLTYLLVLGVVPGTNIDVGLPISFVLLCVALFFAVRWAREISAALMEYKTEIALKEAEDAEKAELVKTGESANELVDEEIEIMSI